MDLGARLVGEARDRQPRRMSTAERRVVTALGVGFLAAEGAVLALLPGESRGDPLLMAVLVALYAVASRVEFEIGSGYAVPAQLVFVPMLFLAPLPLVPLLVAAAYLLAALPDFLSRRTHADRWIDTLSDSWFSIGPVVVLGLLAPGEPRLEHAGVYLAALAAQVACGAGQAMISHGLGSGLHPREAMKTAAWSYRIDVVLSPVALAVALVAHDAPLAALAAAPLIWLLHTFSRERKHRYAAALELNRAYRGTVILLSDVVEAEDNYTADHCRSVVELVNAVADELQVAPDARQELEFAALLHDVGKISMPKEILNKPAALSPEEFALIKRHTLEGQALLDRVGGLLARVGQIVRSCHERWDGTGYPDGLAGYEIPLAARIVFCCDAYSAMTTDRPYRAAMSMETALEELWANAGTQFDARVVAALSNTVRAGDVEPEHIPADAVRAVLASRPMPPLPATR